MSHDTIRKNSANNNEHLGGASSRPDDTTAPKRPPRIPLNAGQNLHVSDSLLDRENFAYRWFAENSIKGGRVENAKGAYWEHVADTHGKNLRRPSGEDNMYLMKLEIEYWQEDQKLKQKKVDATMKAETAIGAGEYAPTSDGKSPEGGTSAINRYSDR